MNKFLETRGKEKRGNLEREDKKALGSNEENVDTVQLWFQEESIYPEKHYSTSLWFGCIPVEEEDSKEHRILGVGFGRDGDELSAEKKSFSSGQQKHLP